MLVTKGGRLRGEKKTFYDGGSLPDMAKNREKRKTRP